MAPQEAELLDVVRKSLTASEVISKRKRIEAVHLEGARPETELVVIFTYRHSGTSEEFRFPIWKVYATGDGALSPDDAERDVWVSVTRA